MKKQIVYDEKDIIHIDREALHRELRNVLAEQNIPEEYRIYMEMLEDMFTIAKTSDAVFNVLQTMNSQAALDQASSDQCRKMISDNDALLEKWEQTLLHR